MEYTIILSIVVAALIAMQVYMKRGVQSAIKAAADQLGTQTEGEIIDLQEGGYLLGSNALSYSKETSRTLTAPLESGDYYEQDMHITSRQTTNSFTNTEYYLGKAESRTRACQEKGETCDYGHYGNSQCCDPEVKLWCRSDYSNPFLNPAPQKCTDCGFQGNRCNPTATSGPFKCCAGLICDTWGLTYYVCYHN